MAVVARVSKYTDSELLLFQLWKHILGIAATHHLGCRLLRSVVFRHHNGVRLTSLRRARSDMTLVSTPQLCLRSNKTLSSSTLRIWVSLTNGCPPFMSLVQLTISGRMVL